MEILTDLFIFVNKKMIDRIKKLLEIKQLSPSQFADEIGLQRSSLSHVLSGRNKPSLDFVIKIKQRFSEIDLEWLVFGKGRMETKSSDIHSEKKEISNQNTIVSDQQLLNFDLEDNDSNNLLEEEEQKTKVRDNTKSSSLKASKVIILFDNGSFQEYTSN